LLGAAMEQSDVRVDALYDLAVKLHDQAKDAVRRRVLGPEVDRVIVDLLVAGIARMAEVAARPLAADIDFDAPPALLGARVGHVVAPPEPLPRRPLGFGAGPASGLLTSLTAFARRDLRASLVATASAGAPPPVCAGVSVVFGVSALVSAFSGGVVGAGAGEGAPGSSPTVAFSSPGRRYSGPSHGIRKSKVRKSCGSCTGS